MRMDSPVTAPSWTDASGTRTGEVDGLADAACLLITVHAAKESTGGDGGDGGGTVRTDLLAWAVLPLFAPRDTEGLEQRQGAAEQEQHLNAGRFQLPLFSAGKPLSKDLVAGFAAREQKDATSAGSLKQLNKLKRLLALDGASVFVRVVDLQLRPELRPTATAKKIDLSQLSIGPPKKSYTAPVAAVRTRTHFCLTQRAESERR